MTRRGGRSSPRALQIARTTLLALVVSGCAHPPATPPARFGPRPPGALEVQLVFDAAADLDLFVTDPRREAVYFGNNPSRGGGRLDGDRRCDAPAPRTETVRFEAPPAGRYRVGIAYDRSCRFRRRPAAFRVEVAAPGLRLERRGEIEPGRFEPIVLEFDWPAPGTPAARAPARPRGGPMD